MKTKQDAIDAAEYLAEQVKELKKSPIRYQELGVSSLTEKSQAVFDVEMMELSIYHMAIGEPLPKNIDGGVRIERPPLTALDVTIFCDRIIKVLQG